MSAEQLAADLRGRGAPRRLAAAEALVELGPEATPAAAALVEACGDSALCDLCVEALEAIGPPPPDQLDRIARQLPSEDELTCYWAATLLGRAGEAAAAYAPALAAVALNEGALVANRERAVWALGKLGQAAAPVADTLRRFAESAPSPRMKRLANEALKNLA